MDAGGAVALLVAVFVVDLVAAVDALFGRTELFTTSVAADHVVLRGHVSSLGVCGGLLLL